MALAIDQSVHVAASGTSITTGTFSTTTANELFVAFVASDGFFNGSFVDFSVSDSTSMVWQPLVGEGIQSGGVQVFYTLATATKTSMTVTAKLNSYMGSGDRFSLLVVTFTGHNTTTPLGAVSAANGTTTPSLSLTTVGANSWVWAAVASQSKSAATAGTNQTVQWQDPSAGSDGSEIVWKQNATTGSAGTSVTMNLTAPSAAYNAVALEIIDAAATLGSKLIVDNVTTGLRAAGGSGATVTVAHTCNGSNPLLIALIAVDDSNQHANQTTSVTYGGTNLTKLVVADNGTGESRAEIWYLVTPTTGSSQNLVVTYNNLNYVGVAAVSFQNAKQGAPTISGTSTTLTSGAASISLSPTTANSWAIGAFVSQAPITPTTTNNGYLLFENWNQSFQQGGGGIWQQLGATGSKTFTINGGSSSLGYAAAIIEPVPSGTPQAAKSLFFGAMF